MKNLSKHELEEYQCMIGRMMLECDKFKHIAGPHAKHMARLQKEYENVAIRLDRIESEAEAAYFKAHPELNP